jgi:hypothetical protein
MACRSKFGRTSFILGALVCCLASPVYAQPAGGKCQPDYLPFGTVRTGAVVEGSVRVFEDGDDIAGVGAKVDAPPFIRVKEVTLGTQRFGSFGTKVVCDVSLSIDTREKAALSSTMDIHIGARDVKVPMSADVVASNENETNVLVVETPFSKFSTGDAKDFTAWLDLVKSANLNVSYYLVERPPQLVLRHIDLSGFDVILLATEGLCFVQKEDLQRLREFAENGGRVVVAANAFFGNTVERANDLFIPYGMKMAKTEVYPPARVKTKDIANHPLTIGIRELLFFRASPVALSPKSKGRILVPAIGFPDQGFVAIVPAAKGDIVVLGQSLWWNWIGPGANGSDNPRFLANIVRRPHGKQVTRN